MLWIQGKSLPTFLMDKSDGGCRLNDLKKVKAVGILFSLTELKIFRLKKKVFEIKILSFEKKKTLPFFKYVLEAAVVIVYKKKILTAL